MGFETKTEGQAADAVKAPLSLVENYRRWLRSVRDRIDSELAGEVMAAEWLKKTLPRLEEDEKVTPEEEPKLQMLKEFVLDSMLREPPPEGEARVQIRGREEDDEDEKKCAAAARKKVLLRSKRYLVATGVALSSFAVLAFSGFFIPSENSSPSEFRRFMRIEAAVLAVFWAAFLVRNLVIRSLMGGTDGTAATQLSCGSSPAHYAV